jgi:hypothetical protein
MQTVDERPSFVLEHGADGMTLGIGIVGRRTPEMEHIASVLRKRWARSAAIRHHGMKGRYRIWRAKKGVGQRRRVYAISDVRGNRVVYRRHTHFSGAELYLINALGPDGTTHPSRVAHLVRFVRDQSPDVPIVVVLDESNPAALRAARDAGATEYLGAREVANDEAIHWRVWDTVAESRRSTLLPRGTRRQEVGVEAELLPPARVTPAEAPSDAEVAAAREAIKGMIDHLPTPLERITRAAEWIRVDAPALRDPKSGRLDAARIAAVLGVPVSRLAAVAGVTQQALSARPDSPKAQAGLQPIARVLAALEDLLPQAHRQMWLNTPLQRLGGETPLAMILDGRADVLARTLERAIEGGSE